MVTTTGLNVHLPGLTKWVFPTLEEEMRVQPKRIYTYRDLLELFETSTKRHATRVAMRLSAMAAKSNTPMPTYASWLPGPPASSQAKGLSTATA